MSRKGSNDKLRPITGGPISSDNPEAGKQNDVDVASDKRLNINEIRDDYFLVCEERQLTFLRCNDLRLCLFEYI